MKDDKCFFCVKLSGGVSLTMLLEIQSAIAFSDAHVSSHFSEVHRKAHLFCNWN